MQITWVNNKRWLGRLGVSLYCTAKTPVIGILHQGQEVL